MQNLGYFSFKSSVNQNEKPHRHIHAHTSNVQTLVNSLSSPRIWALFRQNSHVNDMK